jgi:two-component system cell cycle sensor histidine kinase/response regulator CckA
MNPQSFTLSVISFSTAIIAALVSFYSWRSRKVRGGIYFILLMMAITVYAFANGGELASLSVSTKITWSKLSYLGVVSLSPLFFLFSASYSQHDGWLKRRWIAVIWIIVLATWAIRLDS